MFLGSHLSCNAHFLQDTNLQLFTDNLICRFNQANKKKYIVFEEQVVLKFRLNSKPTNIQRLYNDLMNHELLKVYLYLQKLQWKNCVYTYLQLSLQKRCHYLTYLVEEKLHIKWTDRNLKSFVKIFRKLGAPRQSNYFLFWVFFNDFLFVHKRK